MDLAYPSRSVAIEADGLRFHGGREPPDAGADPVYRDRRRQNALIALNWKVIRLTWRDLIDRPELAVAEVRRALGPP